MARRSVAADLCGDSPAPVGLRQSEYARHRGVSEQAVSRAVAAGRITVGADGRIDPVTADAEWAARTDAAMRPGAKPPALMDSRSRKMAADAALAEIRAKEAAGELISLADARRGWYAAGRTVRERLLAVPDHAGPALGLTAAQVTGLRDTLRRVLADLPEEMPQ